MHKQKDLKKIVFTVTNDLNYDQRMIRICSSLSNAGYDVTLVGIQSTTGPAPQNYRQKRLDPFFKKGFGFYAAYNIRLFLHLLSVKADITCCIDLDTMPAVWLAAKFKNTTKVYDAHEYFSQQKEVVTRPGVHRVWKWIEKTFVPTFKNGYTVSESIAGEFKKLYGVDYAVIRNLPVLKPLPGHTQEAERIILYQGAVNEARGLESLVPAMQGIDAKLQIYGDGNFLEQTKSLVVSNNLQEKVFVNSKVLPAELDSITQSAYIGLNLVENTGLNQYYSLANKFFDYIQFGLPQVSMNFPEYKKINDAFEVAVLIDDLQPDTIAKAIKTLLYDEDLYKRLQQNCLKARLVLNWQAEETRLLDFYKNII